MPDQFRIGDRIARTPEAKAIVGVPSNTTFWRLVKQGDLPQPIHLSTQLRGFIVRELIEHVNRKAGKAA